MKKILFSLLTLAAFNSVNAQTIVYFEDFESYEDFTISDFGDWKQYDQDGGTTWSIQDVTFKNQGYVGSGIIFNNDLAQGSNSSLNSYSGKKGLYYFASGASDTNYPNDDWTVSPLISLADVSKSKLELYAKGNQLYGPDQFNIGVSTTGDIKDFVFINSSPVIPPSGDYTKYEFDLSEFDGKEIYIAINCTTDDGLYLMIDDVKVTGETLGITDMNQAKVAVYPNPVQDEFKLNLSQAYNAAKVQVTVTDLTGRKVKSFSAGEIYNVSGLSKGVYIITVTDGTNKFTQKLIKK